MTDRTQALRSPGIMSLVREAMRRSPSHMVDGEIPLAIRLLLIEIDEAQARHKAQIAAFRAGQR